MESTSAIPTLFGGLPFHTEAVGRGHGLAVPSAEMKSLALASPPSATTPEDLKHDSATTLWPPGSYREQGEDARGNAGAGARASVCGFTGR
jgi:hypothetical protein